MNKLGFKDLLKIDNLDQARTYFNTKRNEKNTQFTDTFGTNDVLPRLGA